MSATATLRPLRQIYDWVCVNGEDCQIIEDPNHSTNIKVRFQDGREQYVFWMNIFPEKNPVKRLTDFYDRLIDEIVSEIIKERVKLDRDVYSKREYVLPLFGPLSVHTSQNSDEKKAPNQRIIIK
jgi:hypothetical protein